MYKMGACVSVHKCVGFHCPCRFPQLYKQFKLLYEKSVKDQREFSSWYLVNGTVTSNGVMRPVSYVDVHTHPRCPALSHAYNLLSAEDYLCCLQLTNERAVQCSAVVCSELIFWYWPTDSLATFYRYDEPRAKSRVIVFHVVRIVYLIGEIEIDDFLNASLAWGYTWSATHAQVFRQPVYIAFFID